MTALTYFLGAVSLKVLRRKTGRAGYWLLMPAVSAALYGAGLEYLGIMFFSLVVLVGVFAEFEEMGLSLSVSAFFTLVINSLLAGGAFAIWVYMTGPQWSKILLGHFETVLKPLADLDPQRQLNYYDLMLVSPSAVLIMWICAIYLALLLESRLLGGNVENAAPEPAAPMNQQALELRLPDATVWILIASLLGTYGGFGNRVVEMVATNAFNVCLVLFFFQGVGVVARFFEWLRVGWFWQVLCMALVVYLMPFIAVLGLADYWIDFRTRLNKRREALKRDGEIG